MRPLLIGLAGGTASGKTTLAARLAERLGAALIPHDRYYKDVPDPRAHNFDHPDALDSDLLAGHLTELRAGRSVELPVYDFSTHRRGARTERLRPRPSIVVEGILLFHERTLREQFDVRAYVHAAADLRLARRLRRDMAERGRTAESVLDQYLATVRPMHDRYVEPSRAHAQLTLDGEGDLQAELERLVSAVTARP